MQLEVASIGPSSPVLPALLPPMIQALLFACRQEVLMAPSNGIHHLLHAYNLVWMMAIAIVRIMVMNKFNFSYLCLRLRLQLWSTL